MKQSIIHLVLFFLSVPDSNLSCSLNPYVFNGTTIAGSNLGYYGSGENYLDSPYDAFVDKNGTLYVADSDNYRVQRFLPGSTSGTTIVAGSSGSALYEFGSCNTVFFCRYYAAPFSVYAF